MHAPTNLRGTTLLAAGLLASSACGRLHYDPRAPADGGPGQGMGRPDGGGAGLADGGPGPGEGGASSADGGAPLGPAVVAVTLVVRSTSSESEDPLITRVVWDGSNPWFGDRFPPSLTGPVDRGYAVSATDDDDNAWRAYDGDGVGSSGWSPEAEDLPARLHLALPDGLENDPERVELGLVVGEESSIVVTGVDVELELEDGGRWLVVSRELVPDDYRRFFGDYETTSVSLPPRADWASLP